MQDFYIQDLLVVMDDRVYDEIDKYKALDDLAIYEDSLRVEIEFEFDLGTISVETAKQVINYTDDMTTKELIDNILELNSEKDFFIAKFEGNGEVSSREIENQLDVSFLDTAIQETKEMLDIN